MRFLSKLQKAKLAQLARRAWEYVGSKSAEPLPPLDDWRRAEIFKAVGRHGLTECVNAEFNPVAAHFHSLLGEDGIAMNELLRAGTEQRRQMEVVLLRELERAGLPQSYAEQISRARWGLNVADLDDSQIKQLLFTIKSRVRAKLKKLEAVAA